VATESIGDQDFLAFRDYMKNASGIVLGENKKYLVTNRLGKMMSKFGTQSVEALLDMMKKDDKYRQQIMDAMTTTETTWFRDVYPFEILKDKFLPEIATRQPQEVRIWSAGCSTGQEAYSISMAVQEYLSQKPGALPSNAIQIIGTELSSNLLNIAENGIFEQIDPTSGLSAARKECYFNEVNGGWEINQQIKDRVTFRQFDLKKTFVSLGMFDIIYCRNVLIYFSSEIKKDILSRMSKALKPGGYLVLGASESIANYSDDYESIQWRNGVVYRLKG
jgi:chemotaxis protein methyltransferase CheR